MQVKVILGKTQQGNNEGKFDEDQKSSIRLYEREKGM